LENNKVGGTGSLFVYPAGAAAGSDLDQTLKIMEAKLLKIIITPSLILAILFGAILLLRDGSVFFHDGWLHLKLFCVLLLLAFHGYLSKVRKRFLRNENKKTGVFYRKINEIPPILFLVIVFLVVLKPF